MIGPFREQTGVTLVELIISIVIIAIAATAIFSAMGSGILNSTTPVLREQALAIADAYLEEVYLQSYIDPDGGDTGTCEEGAANRTLFDDVNDYDCISDTSGAIDQSGTAITGLEGYNVAVAVTADTLSSTTAQRIDVTVTHDGASSLSMTLTGYRIDYQ